MKKRALYKLETMRNDIRLDRNDISLASGNIDN